MSGLKMSKGKKGRINSILDGRILIDNIYFDKIPKKKDKILQIKIKLNYSSFGEKWSFK